MGFVVGNLLSVGPSPKVKWYLYSIEPGYDCVATRWVAAHFYKIARELGPWAGIVRGYDSSVSNEITSFLMEYLSDDMGEKVSSALVNRFSILLTHEALPHTGLMTIIPICEPDAPEKIVSDRMTKLISAVRDGKLDAILDAEDNLAIQEGDFDLPILDQGIVLLRRANKLIGLKIPLLFAEIDIARAIEMLLSRYPKINKA